MYIIIYNICINITRQQCDQLKRRKERDEDDKSDKICRRMKSVRTKEQPILKNIYIYSAVAAPPQVKNNIYMHTCI